MSKQIYGDSVSSTSTYSAEPSSLGSSLSYGTNSYSSFYNTTNINLENNDIRKRGIELNERIRQNACKIGYEPTHEEIDNLVNQARNERSKR